MNTILEQFKDKINGTFVFFDRMIIKGHIRQFFSTSGKGYFLSEQNVLLKDFSAYANQVTSGIVAHVEAMAEETHRPLRYLTSAKIPKEQTALEILKNDPVDEGLICILSVVEYCQTLQPLKNRGILPGITVDIISAHDLKPISAVAQLEIAIEGLDLPPLQKGWTVRACMTCICGLR